MKENLKAWEAIKAIEEGVKLQMDFGDNNWMDFGDGYVNGDCQNAVYFILNKGANFRIKPTENKNLKL